MVEVQGGRGDGNRKSGYGTKRKKTTRPNTLELDANERELAKQLETTIIRLKYGNGVVDDDWLKFQVNERKLSDTIKFFKQYGVKFKCESEPTKKGSKDEHQAYYLYVDPQNLRDLIYESDIQKLLHKAREHENKEKTKNPEEHSPSPRCPLDESARASLVIIFTLANSALPMEQQKTYPLSPKNTADDVPSP